VMWKVATLRGVFKDFVGHEHLANDGRNGRSVTTWDTPVQCSMAQRIQLAGTKDKKAGRYVPQVFYNQQYSIPSWNHPTKLAPVVKYLRSQMEIVLAVIRETPGLEELAETLRAELDHKLHVMARGKPTEGHTDTELEEATTYFRHFNNRLIMEWRPLDMHVPDPFASDAKNGVTQARLLNPDHVAGNPCTYAAGGHIIAAIDEQCRLPRTTRGQGPVPCRDAVILYFTGDRPQDAPYYHFPGHISVDVSQMLYYKAIIAFPARYVACHDTKQPFLVSASELVMACQVAPLSLEKSWRLFGKSNGGTAHMNEDAGNTSMPNQNQRDSMYLLEIYYQVNRIQGLQEGGLASLFQCVDMGDITFNKLIFDAIGAEARVPLPQATPRPGLSQSDRNWIRFSPHCEGLCKHAKRHAGNSPPPQPPAETGKDRKPGPPQGPSTSRGTLPPASDYKPANKSKSTTGAGSPAKRTKPNKEDGKARARANPTPSVADSPDSVPPSKKTANGSGGNPPLRPAVAIAAPTASPAPCDPNWSQMNESQFAEHSDRSGGTRHWLKILDDFAPGTQDVSSTTSGREPEETQPSTLPPNTTTPRGPGPPSPSSSVNSLDSRQVPSASPLPSQAHQERMDEDSDQSESTAGGYVISGRYDTNSSAHFPRVGNTEYGSHTPTGRDSPIGVGRGSFSQYLQYHGDAISASGRGFPSPPGFRPPTPGRPLF
jgi:hypothetical protein